MVRDSESLRTFRVISILSHVHEAAWGQLHNVPQNRPLERVKVLQIPPLKRSNLGSKLCCGRIDLRQPGIKKPGLAEQLLIKS